MPRLSGHVEDLGRIVAQWVQMLSGLQLFVNPHRPELTARASRTASCAAR
jgi:hypothetical protein